MKALAHRARTLASTRAFFDGRGYTEVETPALVPSPGLDLHLDAFAVSVNPPRYLTTSPEYQMKRLLADGWRRIYQITRAYRRGERGERHNPEFTILEFYRADAGVEGIMRDTEQLVARATGGRVVLTDRSVDTSPPFDRLSVTEAFERAVGWSRRETLERAREDEDAFFFALVDAVEPWLARHPRAIFLTDYPASHASLARKNPRDPELAERFELYVAGVEVCNGFGELTSEPEQRSRLEADVAERRRRGLPVYPIDEAFLGALARGLPECAGNAVGFDRLCALAAGTTSIADVMAFVDEEL